MTIARDHTCLSVLLVLLFAAGSGICFAEEQAVPPEDRRQQIGAEIRDLFAREYARRDTDSRVALIQTLLREASQTQANPQREYVYLDEARQLAIEAGQVALAIRATKRIAGRFAIDPLEAQVESLTQLRAAGRRPDQVGEYVEAMLQTIEAGIDANAYAKVAPLADILKSTASRLREPAEKISALQTAEDFGQIKQAYETLVALRTDLSESGEPKLDDPQTRSAWGRFLCLYKGDWATGLPHLAAGAEDSDLRPAARRELGDPQTGRECLALADMWQALARDQQGLARRRLENHADHWRIKALPKLPISARKQLREQMVAEGRRLVGNSVLESGLFIEVFADTALRDFQKGWAFGTLRRDWEKAAPLPGNKRAKTFSARITGFIDAPKTGSYLLEVQAEGQLSLWINDEFVISASTGPDNVATVPADFHRGLNAVRLEFVDEGGPASFSIRWSSDGGRRFSPIPFTKLFHAVR